MPIRPSPNPVGCQPTAPTALSRHKLDSRKLPIFYHLLDRDLDFGYLLMQKSRGDINSQALKGRDVRQCKVEPLHGGLCKTLVNIWTIYESMKDHSGIFEMSFFVYKNSSVWLEVKTSKDINYVWVTAPWREVGLILTIVDPVKLSDLSWRHQTSLIWCTWGGLKTHRFGDHDFCCFFWEGLVWVCSFLLFATFPANYFWGDFVCLGGRLILFCVESLSHLSLLIFNCIFNVLCTKLFRLINWKKWMYPPWN